ncbi:DUF2645 family protein [Citrobacter freundii]|uniref:DUF2645 family protein n=1 Tax=Citrobacter freundii TaxID=546 RepID=UPI001FFE11CF|nr:DUF2645 family protein [Citrobacter freundii]
MNSKAISLNVIWGTVSFVLIIIFSTQDKEWFIDGLGVNNICDLMTYVDWPPESPDSWYHLS